MGYATRTPKEENTYNQIAARFALVGCELIERAVPHHYTYTLRDGTRCTWREEGRGGRWFETKQGAMTHALKKLGVKY